MPGEAATGVQPDGVEPELGGPIASLDVDMHRFGPVVRIEEEPVGSYPENRRYRASCSLLVSTLGAAR